LENEKIIVSQQGKGTFVAGKVSGVREANRKDKLLKIIDLAMEEAISLGFSLDDFLTIAYVRAKEKEEMMKKTKIAFIECNEEQLSALIRETDLGQNVASIPFFISELREEPVRIKNALSKADIIVTTPFHIEEVEEFIKGMNKDVIDMILEPKMDTIIRLARIKAGTKLGLVCQSNNFAMEVNRSLKSIGLDNLKLQFTIEVGEELDKFLADKEFIITSPHRYKEIKSKVKTGKETISFDYSPDRGSINMLKTALFDIKVGS
jgi:GntR family transcriptional regulator